MQSREFATMVGRRAVLATAAAILTMYVVSTADAGTSSKKLVVTGTVTGIYELAGPRNGPGPPLRSWGVHVRIEKIKVGKYARGEFYFWTYRPGYTVDHRYTVKVRWTGTIYREDESSPIKEEAWEVLKVRGPAEQAVAADGGAAGK
jgi:hypothetical protein